MLLQYLIKSCNEVTHILNTGLWRLEKLRGSVVQLVDFGTTPGPVLFAMTYSTVGFPPHFLIL